MRRSLLPTPILLLSLLLLSPLGACDGTPDTPSATGGDGDGATPASAPASTGAATTDIPPRYQGLIRSEMTRVEPAMQQLLSFIARGNASMGIHVARQIQDTFVLKSSMTPEQRREMAGALPPEFVTLDRAFHHRAGQLADSLDRRDFRTAAETYAAMTRQCVECHSRYARHRFPSLPPPSPEEASVPDEPASPDGH